MNQMDAIASRSDLREIHPRVKMIYTGITLAICLWASDVLVSILLLGLNTVLITLISKAPVKSYRKVMQIPLVFLLFTALGMMIHIPWTARYLVPDAIRVAELMLRVWAGCSSMFFLSFTTPIFDIITCLHQWKVPEFLTDLMLYMYRFIFLLLDVGDVMQISQRARLGYDSKKSWIHSTANVAVSLFIIAYQKSEQLYIAMECRLYDGKMRYYDEEKREEAGWYVGITVIAVLLILLKGCL